MAAENGRKRKKIFLIGGIIVLIVALVFGVPWYIHSEKYVSTDDAYVRAHVIYVSPQVSALVRSVPVLDNQFVKKGTVLVQLDPRDYQTAVDKYKALLEEALAARQGSRYSLSLIKRTSPAALAQAQAQVAIARAAIATAKAGEAQAAAAYDQAKAHVAAAVAAIARAKADVVADAATSVKAAADYRRYDSLLKTGDVTPQQVDSYRAAAQSAKAILAAAGKIVLSRRAELIEARAGVEAAKENQVAAAAQLTQANANLLKALAQREAVNIVPQQVGQTKSSVSGTTARIDEARAELQQAELNLSYCTIRAPVTGYVTKKSVEPGNYVTVGSTLMSVVRPNMWVVANFKETDLTNMKPNDPVTISIDAYPQYTFKGYVQSIQAGSGAEFSLLPPENATGNFVKVVQRVPVKILFKDLPKNMPYLAAGMSAVPEVKVK
jgi:membrane fusion protein (multidrug efflux system)